MGYPNGSCPQADGNTRSYDDYAVTVNPQLHVPQYPIPLPENMFLKLRGGQLRYCVFTRSVPAHYGHHPSGFRSCGEYTR